MVEPAGADGASAASPDNDADTLTVALMNAPSQMNSAIDNFATVLDMLAPGDLQRGTIGAQLDDAGSRIAALRASV